MKFCRSSSLHNRAQAMVLTFFLLNCVALLPHKGCDRYSQANQWRNGQWFVNGAWTDRRPSGPYSTQPLSPVTNWDVKTLV